MNQTQVNGRERPEPEGPGESCSADYNAASEGDDWDDWVLLIHTKSGSRYVLIEMRAVLLRSDSDE